MGALRGVLAFILLPGTFAYILPHLIVSAGQPRTWWSWAGMLPIAVGSALLIRCTIDFHRVGEGTLAPWWRTRELVRAGAYRWTRNPMYVAVLAVMIGWAIWYASGVLTAYAAAFALGFHVRVVFGEEPRLAQLHGAAWERYRDTVPRWIRVSRR